MVNTYGIRSINQETFNLRDNDKIFYPQNARDIIVLGFRIHNAVLNVLGYIPAVSPVSGCVRIATGLIIVGVVLANHRPLDNEGKGRIIDRWYSEGIATGIAQIARGALEAFVSFGRVANLMLDIIATPFNIYKDMVPPATCARCMGDEEISAQHIHPHPDREYAFSLRILQWV